jgi:uncharacterized protein (UPF0333 family)
MKKRPKYKTGQYSLEYAVVVVCIITALIAMQTYISRGMQGRMRESADSIGEQYAVGNTDSDIRTNYDYDTNIAVRTTEANGITNTATSSNFTENQILRTTERIN